MVVGAPHIEGVLAFEAEDDPILIVYTKRVKSSEVVDQLIIVLWRAS